MSLRKARTQNILQEQERLLALADHLLEDGASPECDPEFDATKYDSRPPSSVGLSRLIADNFMKFVAFGVFLFFMLLIGFMEEVHQGDWAGAFGKIKHEVHKAHAGLTSDSVFHDGVQH
jgi:hypothetical protein